VEKGRDSKDFFTPVSRYFGFFAIFVRFCFWRFLDNFRPFFDSFEWLVDLTYSNKRGLYDSPFLLIFYPF